MNVSTKTQTVLYRIWAYASPRGWDCTVTEIAEHLNISSQQVGSVLKFKPEWRNRLRVTENKIAMMHVFDGRNSVDDNHPILGAIQ